MLTELRGKGGSVCDSARQGQIRCPLMIRPTSEDVITGHLVQVLSAIQPRHWLPQLLNAGLGTQRFHQQVYRGLQIELWKNLPPFPQELLPWREGSTQVDVAIRWENPPTTVYLEAKYLSPLSPSTTNHPGSEKFPGDQLLRNIRVGLWQTGWLQDRGLFLPHRRRFAVLLLTPLPGNSLVAAYRNVDQLRRSLPCGDQLRSLPPLPFVGELPWGRLISVLRGQSRHMCRPERILVNQLCEYLAFKAADISRGPLPPNKEPPRLPAVPARVGLPTLLPAATS